MPVLLFLLAFLLTGMAGYSQKEFDGLRGTKNWIGSSDAPNALYRHIAGLAYADLGRRSRQVEKIRTLAEWQQRQRWLRKVLADAIGPFPSRTPLDAVVTRVVAKDGYHFENIVFQSRPGYYVTSTLFVPDGAHGAPAIIYCSGHSDDGYRSAIYIREILNFVRKGFVVFAFDPMGQGERLQYYDTVKGRSRFRYPAYEHSYAGAQIFMTGRTLASYFVWDGIRAIDYLYTRKEVDSSRVGITGRSGGGTQTAFIAAFDGRIRAAAPENYITNMRMLMRSMGPQDAEQNFLYGLARGLDMADLLEVRAPAPAMVIATTQDMFPIQGALETVEEVKRVYAAYGRQENFGLVTDDAPHASTRKNREAAYAFFQRVFHVAGSPVEEEVAGLSTEELRVTATGQVSTSLHGMTAFDINREDAARRMAGLSGVRKGILDSARRLSGFVRPGPVPAPWFAGRAQRKGYVIEKYLLKGEGEYMMPYIVLRPDAVVGKAVIYLNPLGKAADAKEGGDMESLALSGVMVVAPDLPGIGELGPGVFQGDSYVDSVSYNLWFAAMLVGRSIVGIQAGDVVRLTDRLKSEGVREIYGLAKGTMGPVMLHAAAFDRDIRKVALIGSYGSYGRIAMDSAYDPRLLYSTVAGAVGVYDLPDLEASLAPRALLIAGMAGELSNKLKKWIEE